MLHLAALDDRIKVAVPVVMVSHKAKEADVKKALSEIAALDVVSDEPVLIRIEDDKLD